MDLERSIRLRVSFAQVWSGGEVIMLSLCAIKNDLSSDAGRGFPRWPFRRYACAAWRSSRWCTALCTVRDCKQETRAPPPFVFPFSCGVQLRAGPSKAARRVLLSSTRNHGFHFFSSFRVGNPDPDGSFQPHGPQHGSTAHSRRPARMNGFSHKPAHVVPV